MMKKLISIIALAAVLFCGLSCSKDNSVPEIELKSVSATSFDAAGGFGTAVVETGGLKLTAESSAPDWLRVSVAGSSVLFCSMCSHILVIQSALRMLPSMLKAAIPSAFQ